MPLWPPKAHSRDTVSSGGAVLIWPLFFESTFRVGCTMTCSSPVLPLGSREEGADAVTSEKIADVLTVSMACLCQYGVSLARLHF